MKNSWDTWVCSNPAHIGDNKFTPLDPVWGCCTVGDCKWTICLKCWNTQYTANNSLFAFSSLGKPVEVTSPSVKVHDSVNEFDIIEQNGEIIDSQQIKIPHAKSLRVEVRRNIVEPGSLLFPSLKSKYSLMLKLQGDSDSGIRLNTFFLSYSNSSSLGSLSKN